jgi:hypothetical protein
MRSGEGTSTPFRDADRSIEQPLTPTPLTIRTVNAAHSARLVTLLSDDRSPKLATRVAVISISSAHSRPTRVHQSVEP